MNHGDDDHALLPLDGGDDDLDLSRFPQSQTREFITTAAKVLASFLPVGGGAAVELLNALAPVMNERRIAWLEYVGRAVGRLQDQVEGLDPQRLFQRPEFTSVFLQASQIAMRTHQREKLRMLRNAVLNAARPDSPDENLQFTFLNYVDDLTPLHIHLLQAIADRQKWADDHHFPIHDPNIDPVQMFEGANRRTLPVHEFEKVLARDLYNRGLATTGADPYGPLYPSDEGTRMPRITMLGRQFLAFITSPLVDDPDGVAPDQPEEAPHEQV